MPIVLADSPAQVDGLKRRDYVEALATVILKCETPFVVGVYGDWGAGKTTILQLLKNQLQSSDVKCVWFNAWLHQSDENPALAMLHAIASDLNVTVAARKTLAVLGETLASSLLKVTTTIQTEDIRKVAERYEEEQFAKRDAKTRLREQFEKFVKSVRGRDKSRVALIIDDLDRCRPDVALRVLEAIQLYLNLEGCVFILAADRIALEHIVATRYGERFTGNERFLDKIVQLPFVIPPLDPRVLEELTLEHVSPELRGCVKLVIAGIGPNPRAVKRFVNVLALNDHLAKAAKIADYDVRWLCVVLLVQYLDQEKFALLVADASLFDEIAAEAEKGKARLGEVLSEVHMPPENLQDYIHLSTSSGIEDVAEASPKFMTPMQPSPELAAIIGPDPQPRTEITTKIWAYIKNHGLQDKKNPRIVHADEMLRPIFEADELSLFEMTKKLSRHIK